MKKKNNGIALLYVLFIASLISIYMSSAIQQLLQTVFVTKKFTGSQKAYWASFAGQEYVKGKLYGNLKWPYSSDLTSEQYGDYIIDFTKYGEDIQIHGKNEDKMSEFYIYFSKQQYTKTDTDGTSYTSIVPKNLPDGMTSCSYNTIANDSTETGISKIETSINPTRQATITTPGIYIASEGLSGAYKSITEKLIRAEDTDIYSGGIYSGGDIDINLKGSNAIMQLSKESTAKPDIFCQGTFSVNRDINTENVTDGTTIKTLFPVSLDEGTVYYKDNITIKDNVTNSVYSPNDISDRTTFKRKYGLNVDRYNSANEFPSADWNSISEYAKNNFKKSIPKGTYTAIFCEDTQKYLFYYIPVDTSHQNQVAANEATDNIATTINNCPNLKDLDHAAKAQEIDNAIKVVYPNSVKIEEIQGLKKLSEDKNFGESLTIDTHITVEKKKDISTSQIITTKTYTPTIHVDTDVQVTDATDQSGNAIQGISFVSLVRDWSYPNKYIRSSKPFNFVFNSNIKEVYLPDDDKDKNKSNNNDDDNNSLSFLLSKKTFTKDPASLYCDGPVRINGMIKGEGQLLSGDAVYFESGSDLNVISENDKKIYGESNQIAIYAQGSVTMGFLESTRNSTFINDKLKISMVGKSAYSQSALMENILNSHICFSHDDYGEIDGLDLPRDCTLRYFLKEYAGYNNKEAQCLVSKTIESNMYVTTHTKTDSLGNSHKYYVYHMPNNLADIAITQQAPSSFCGIIYTCGGFYANMLNNPMTINGAIVSYGGVPGKSLPGSGVGLTQESLMGLAPGSLKIDNCTAFNIIYDSNTMDAFLANASTTSMANLVTVYFNKL